MPNEILLDCFSGAYQTTVEPTTVKSFSMTNSTFILMADNVKQHEEDRDRDKGP